MSPPVAIETTPVQAKPVNGTPQVDDRVKQNELKELAIADEMGGKDMYIDAEADTEWYHWVGSSKYKRFDGDESSH